MTTKKSKQDDNNILSDGERLVVPLYLMDSAGQKTVRLDDVSSLHRPGFRFPADAKQTAALDEAYAAADRDTLQCSCGPDRLIPVKSKSGNAVLDAYADRDAHDEQAWRAGLTREDDTTQEFIGSQSQDGTNKMDARDAAYRLSDWESSNAWRGQAWLAANRPT
jgi:hypothetical protein